MVCSAPLQQGSSASRVIAEMISFDCCASCRKQASSAAETLAVISFMKANAI